MITNIAPDWILAAPENRDLFAVMRQSGASVARYDSPSEAIAQAPEGGAVLLLATEYPDHPQSISESLLNEARRKRLRLYIEFPKTIPGLESGAIKFLATGEYGSIVDRLVVATDVPGSALERYRIMNYYDCWHRPISGGDPWLVLARVAGYDRAELGLPEKTTPVLVAHPDENWLVAGTMLSNFVTARCNPKDAWRVLWQSILQWLNPGATPPDLDWTPTVSVHYCPGDSLPADALEHCLHEACDWLWRSQLLVDPSLQDHIKRPEASYEPLPPDWQPGDGSSGIMEGPSSKRIFSDGRHAIAPMVRADGCCQMAMVGALASRLFGKCKGRDVSENLLDFVYKTSGIHISGGQPDDPMYGHLGWGTEGSTRGMLFSDDAARALLGTIVSAALLDHGKWDDAIARIILANLRTTGQRGFRPDKLLIEKDLHEKGWRHFWNWDGTDLIPHFHATILAVFLWAYGQTGFKPLYDRARAGLREFVAGFPDGWYAEGGRFEAEVCHIILPLAWLVRVDDTPEHRDWLRLMTDYLAKQMQPCGALHQVVTWQYTTEIDPVKRHIIHHPIASNELYGYEEGPLAYKTGDPVTDLLYAFNFAFVGLHEAAAATGEAIYTNLVQRMADLCLRIQTVSRKHPELHGSWYRAFDDRKWEYYGSESDWGYGALLMESGWTHSMITGTLAMMQMKTDLWTLTRSSRIVEAFSKIQPAMLPDADWR